MVSGATPPPPLLPWEGDAVSPLAYRLRRSRGPKTSAPTMLLSTIPKPLREHLEALRPFVQAFFAVQVELVRRRPAISVSDQR